MSDARRFTQAAPTGTRVAPLAMSLGLGNVPTVPRQYLDLKYRPPSTSTAVAPVNDKTRYAVGPSYSGGGDGGSGGASGGPGGPAGGPGAPGAPGGPGAPPGTPGAAPVTTTVQQPTLAPWQHQQQYVAQNVSVPVSVSMAPTSSYTVGPPPPQDIGPVVPAGVGAGMSAFMTSRCVQFAILGAFVAYLMKRRG